MMESKRTIQCSHCTQRFATENDRWMHSKAKHNGLPNPRPARNTENESYASRIISARDDAAAGRHVDADLKLMFHDEIYGA
jgi:hypothetical protein